MKILLQGFLALLFTAIVVTNWVCMIVLGWMQGDDWYSILGLYCNTHMFWNINIAGTPMAVLAVWRLLQMLGWARENAGVRASNAVLVGIGAGIVVNTIIMLAPWEGDGGGPEPPSDAELEYPTLPLAPPQPDAPWELTALDGTAVKLEDLKGKAVFVNLWATWCGFCLLEFPNLQRLYDQFKDDPNVVFLFVTKEDKETVEAWRQSDEGKQYTLPFYTTEEIPKSYEPSGWPTTFIIAPNGQTAFEHSGFVAWDGQKTQDFLKQLSTQPAS